MLFEVRCTSKIGLTALSQGLAPGIVRPLVATAIFLRDNSFAQSNEYKSLITVKNQIDLIFRSDFGTKFRQE